LASADPGRTVGRRSAAEIEAALNAALGRTAPEPAQTVEELAAYAPEAPTPAREALRIPLPTAAPRATVAAEPEIATATDVAAANPPIPPVPPAQSGRPAFEEPVRMAALQNDTDPRVAALYETGVATTEKSARPALSTASTAPVGIPPADIVPVDQIDPARFGSWTTAQLSITDFGRPAARPVFIQNALREAPTEVYTDGFRKHAAPDPRRFSGNAVNFLTVAKFTSGSGGDGRPLTLQLPVAN
jgi:hypothetical protein